MTYLEKIESTRLISDVETILTTGDPEYPGTAIEVWDSGQEILHIVVDSKGEQQLLFFGGAGDYRIPVARFKDLLSSAEARVKFAPE